MSSRRQPLPQDSTWQAFQQLHEGHPWLSEDPLYALTEDVIDAIQQHVPQFFSEQQEKFERDLVRRTGAGFFLRRPLGPPTSVLYRPGLTIGEFLTYAPLPQKAQASAQRLAPDLKPEWFKDEYTEQALRAIRELIAQLWEAGGRSAENIQQAQRQAREEGGLLVRRAEAYAGWLICNPRFQRERAWLQRSWGAAIVRRGGFPQQEGTAVGDPSSSPPRRRDSCTKACLAFYRRWGLDRLLTWDLPAPLDALLHPSSSEGHHRTSEEGVSLFLPWYLVRGGQFDLQQVVQRIRFESAPEHLRSWLQKPSEREAHAAGDISYQRLYWLYRCYELVLFRRYRSACEKNIERLDRAMAAVMQREEDWVKRLRQRLTRALQGRGR